MSTTQQIQDRYWSKNQRRRRRPDHPVVRATFEPLADIVASAVDSPQEATVLDVGCGNGFLQWPLEHRFRSVTGIDASRQMLEVNPCEETLLGSCTDLPFVDKSFDVAVACHLLHHLAEPDRARTLAEMNRVARHAVVSFEPNRNNPLLFVLSLLKPAERMATQFSASYMRELFHDAGIVAVQVQTETWILHNTAPFWWVPIGRALEQTPLRELGFDICCVGQIGPWRGGGIP
jgi:2-polyprenyl-3-methyl-5-hydroxy-6-metoxy-1,4-benzoquinol methylase